MSCQCIGGRLEAVVRRGLPWSAVVCRSGYYAARKRQAQPRVVCAASAQAKAAFEASGRSYGSRRLSQALKARNLPIGRHCARTLMRMNGLPTWRWRHRPARLHACSDCSDCSDCSQYLLMRHRPVHPSYLWGVRIARGNVQLTDAKSAWSPMLLNST